MVINPRPIIYPSDPRVVFVNQAPRMVMVSPGSAYIQPTVSRTTIVNQTNGYPSSSTVTVVNGLSQVVVSSSSGRNVRRWM